MILEKVLDVVVDVAKAFFTFVEPFVYLGAKVLEFIDTMVQVYEILQNFKKSHPMMVNIISGMMTFWRLFTGVTVIMGSLKTAIKIALAPLIFFFKNVRRGAYALGLLFDGLEKVFASIFSTPRNPPNAFQGLIQLVEIFTNFGSAVFNLETPLRFITGLLDTMFKTVFSSFGILVDAFNLLLELAKTDLTAINETFDSVSTAADSLNKISLAKMAMLTAGSTANALAQTVESASRVITAETGNNDKPIQINLTIEMDGEKFAKKVINITDREISTRRRIG